MWGTNEGQGQLRTRLVLVFDRLVGEQQVDVGTEVDARVQAWTEAHEFIVGKKGGREDRGGRTDIRVGKDGHAVLSILIREPCRNPGRGCHGGRGCIRGRECLLGHRRAPTLRAGILNGEVRLGDEGEVVDVVTQLAGQTEEGEDVPVGVLVR